jgi:hypothetical protein
MGGGCSCLCGGDPFLRNSHFSNRDDFSLALRRNDSFTFFQVRPDTRHCSFRFGNTHLLAQIIFWQ